MAELEQLPTHSDAAPFRVVPGHLQYELLELGIHSWPPWAAPATKGCPSSPHQLAMPTQNRLRLDQHPYQSRSVHPFAQRGHDRPIRCIQLRLLDLTTHDADLMPEEK